MLERIAPSATITPFWDHPAFATAITGVVAIIVLAVNSWLNTRMHQEKLRADRSLAREKFDFDRHAAEHKAQLDRELDQWRRRVTFAEQELTAFYDVQSRIQSIRSPAAFGGEAEIRPKRDEETEQLRQQRDAYYPVAKRFSDNADFLNAFYSRRLMAVALLGPQATQPYEAMWQQLVAINVAVRMLLRPGAWANDPSAAKRRDEKEKVIWDGYGESDRIASGVAEAVVGAEALFRPVVQPPPR
jgi:FtsZ-interacting cell division protein ZipA